MEKIPGACAMDWSIELEKSLRSLKPDKSIQALEEIGRRLEWWNSESELTFAEYRMFGLIPSEDKLFLNAIFLRLADSFRLGNKQIKNGIVRLFLRMNRRKKRDGQGILSAGKLDNFLELLSRVKEVFDKGDVEEKALALVLLGCWAYFAKDCVDVRYTVLSSLVSDDVLVVKAALFAGGCFCEISDDFANVFLEILSTAILSREISRDIKLAAARAYGKNWCSFSLADKAYKTGLKLLMDSSEDDFSAVMLISLSRVASRWMLLIPIQVELLTLFLSEDKSLRMQIASLKCHRFILARGACNFPSTTDTIQKLFGILQRSEIHPSLQLEALRILHKILLFNLSIIPRVEISELFLKLLAVVKNMQQSSIVSTRVLAVSVLADLSGKVLGSVDNVSGGTNPALAFQVISFVFDQILSLVAKKVDIHQPNPAAELEVKSLINIINNLVEQHPYLNCLLLNNLCLFLDKLMKMLNKVMEMEKTGLSNHEMAEYGSDLKTLIESKLMIRVSKIVVACVQNLEEIDAETIQVMDLLKLVAENVCHCSYLGNYTRLSYFLLLHLHSTFVCVRHMMEELMSSSRRFSISCVDSVLQLDISTVDCAKKILGGNSYWYSYKAGRTAACQGAWSTAAFVFEQLRTVVNSASCSCWLKCLTLFSTSENEIQLFLLSDHSTPFVPSESNAGEREGTALRTNCGTYMENLLRACNTLFSAEEVLAASNMGHLFSFQRWFLNLRAKVVKTAVDVIKLLESSSFARYGSGPGGQLERCVLLQATTTLGPLMCSSMEISCQMKKLARELDLLLMSFWGMDRQSVTSISALALGCSVLAFTAGFAFLVPNFHSLENYRIPRFERLDEPFHALLIEDLMGRLRHIDSETRKNLMFLLKSFHNKDCFSPKLETQISYTDYEGIILRKLCEYSVGEIFALQNAATRVQQDDVAVSQIQQDGLQLMLNVISKLMLIPFRAPHQFFRVRPAVSSELFVMNEDGQVVDGSSILSGVHLSLNLCLQLKNMPPGLPRQLKKIYCILSCETHSQIVPEFGKSRGQSQISTQGRDIDGMMDLNEKLLRYINGSVETNGLHFRDQANDCMVVNEYVCFELSERGQGFSTCLLDVSSLPSGSYRIKWHSGCTDREGCYWSLLPVNAGPLFTVCEQTTVL